MAQVNCTGCGNYCVIQLTASVIRIAREGITNASPDKIRGVYICPQCTTQTLFEQTGDALTFMPGAMFSEDMSPNAPDQVKDAFQDALRCFYGQGHRGAVGMCRSAIEESLDAKGAKGNDLYQKIEFAKNTLGILGDEQVAAAQAARLIGRNALHRGMDISPTQAMLALQATLDLINYIDEP